MEDQLLQYLATFLAGAVVGAVVILLWNKLKAGAASPANLKQEYEEYKNQVEEHFEETSRRFKDMTEQYQDLYRHLSVGATSLCRPDSVAASLADESLAQPKLTAKSDTSARDSETSPEETSVVAEQEITDDADAENPESSAHAAKSSEEGSDSKA